MQSRTNFRTTRVAAAVVAIAAFAASASSFAGGGEALDIELPSMRSPVAASPVLASPQEASLAATSAYASASFGGALTREQVREQLRQARADGTLSMQGEAGDTPRVLAAREAFNVAQGEAIMAEYAADQQRTVALAEAEVRRAEIETEAQLAQSLALSDGEELVPEGGAAADSEGTAVRIDVIDLQTSATASPNEMVIVSLDGGDAAMQHDRAMHVRRQLAAMGLAQGQIYIESTGAQAEGEAVAAAEGDMEVSAINDGDAAVSAMVDGDSASALLEDEGS